MNGSVSNVLTQSGGVRSDGIFGDNTGAQMAAMTASLSGSVSTGYTGTITIGVPV